MLTHELIALMQEILDELDEYQGFLNDLEILAVGYRNTISNLIDSKGNLNPLAQFSSSMAPVKKEFDNGMKPRKFFEKVKNLEELIDGFSDYGFKDDLSRQLAELSEAYELSLTNTDAKVFFKFAIIAEKVYFSTNTMRQFLVSTIQELEIEPSEIQAHPLRPDPDIELEVLTIHLFAQIEIEEFGNKLISIDNIYKELSLLISSPIVINPARVIKIESGSLWTKLEADPKSNQLFEMIISEIANIVYRRFTRSGKIEAQKEALNVIKDLIDLRTKLEDLDIDTSKADEIIQKSTIIIAENALKLIEGQAGLSINETIVQITDTLKTKYLEAGAIQKLKEGSVENANIAKASNTD
jgi:hypothetical protein